MFDIHGFEMTVFKLLIGVTLIVLHLRLTGKQQTVQLTPIDFIGNFILGGIIGVSSTTTLFLSRNTSVFSW